MYSAKKLKEKLTKGKLTIGSWLQIGHPVVAEIMAGAGFEWLVVDLEHSVIGLEDAQVLFQVIEARGVVPLVRVSSNDAVEIKRVMDAGACGVIVPNVNSGQDAKRALSAARYPPGGARGVGIYRAQGYGASFQEYFTRANKETIVIVQIEHKDGVDNIAEILDNDIDGIIIGPYDISTSYGVTGDFKYPKVVKAIGKVKNAVKKTNKALGFHVVYPQADEVFNRVKEGFNFIAYSVDTIILQHYSANMLRQVRDLVNKGRI